MYARLNGAAAIEENIQSWMTLDTSRLQILGLSGLIDQQRLDDNNVV